MHGPRNQFSPRALLAWLFPQACSLCGEVGAPVNPCRDCARALEPLLLRSVCPRCATPTGDTSGHCPGPASPILLRSTGWSHRGASPRLSAVSFTG